MLALAGGADVGNLVDLEPVDAAGVGEAEDVSVGGGDDELLDEILVARLHARAAGAAAALLAIGGDGRALEVALCETVTATCSSAIRSSSWISAGFVDDLGAALVAVAVRDLFEFLDDDVAQLLVAGEDRFVLGDASSDLAEFLEDLVDRELREAIELQLEDGVDLLRGEAVLVASPRRSPIEVDDDLVPLPNAASRFSRASARELEARMILMTVSRLSSAIW